MTRQLSNTALKALFSADSDDTLVALATFSQDNTIGLTSAINIADNFNTRLTAAPFQETDTEVYYGINSNGTDYLYLPFELTLPIDEAATSPSCTITMRDVTQYIIPKIRVLTGPPSVSIYLVLKSTPNVIEASFSGFKLTNISYTADTVTGTLTMPNLDIEPFPAYGFTPKYFPGLF